jgi:CelD/BcsL family acetyltransferase involved in cellulose biosynthesis
MPAVARLRIRPVDLTSISRETWDRLASANPWATPFSSWAFHRAWWDAYAENAHEQTLVAVPADGPADAEPVAILPLMHRHEEEPGDAERHTTLRHEHGADLTPVPPSAKAIFFGASYHADYATVLARPGDLPAVAEALATHLAEASRAGGADAPWDVVDLRRLRGDDPAVDALATGFRRHEVAEGWTLTLEREDVCPVATLPAGGTLDDFLGTLEKKERHEIRRKVRRAEAAGVVTLTESRDPVMDLDAFIDLHQRRWGADGLFPETAGGAQSRVLFRRLFELFGPTGALRLSFLTVGGRRIAAGVHFETADAVLYYNAGVDPDARDLSPGVVMVERFIRRALERGQRRLDFLRGNEAYKYEWGALDEPIQRLLLRRAIG